MRCLAAALAIGLYAGTASGADGVPCGAVAHEGDRYTVCRVDLDQSDLRLFLYDPSGEPFSQFDALDDTLKRDGLELVFAMNAGMYHEDRSPVGHYVENGQEEMRVISNPGPGNFGLLPNGILCIAQDGVAVVETRSYLKMRPDCTFATQSGPMLVVDGELHPRFLPDSTSRYIRNGVGTSEDGRSAYFAISENAVTFHEFGRLFRDVLKTPNALFLDGNVSRLHSADLDRSDAGRPMGPIVGVVAPMP